MKHLKVSMTHFRGLLDLIICVLFLSSVNAAPPEHRVNEVLLKLNQEEGKINEIHVLKGRFTKDDLKPFKRSLFRDLFKKNPSRYKYVIIKKEKAGINSTTSFLWIRDFHYSSRRIRKRVSKNVELKIKFWEAMEKS